jgi:hypothetical protein
MFLKEQMVRISKNVLINCYIYYAISVVHFHYSFIMTCPHSNIKKMPSNM